MTFRVMTRLLSLSMPLLIVSLAPTAEAGTWSVAKDNMATIIMGVDFLDAQNGYVVGADNASGGSVIFKTNDGGRTWVNQQDNPLQCATYLDVSFGDSSHAVAGGMGMFYRFAGASYTADGRSWKASQDRWLASAYQDVEAVDADHMFMVGTWMRATKSWYGVAASIDGGRSFEYFDWGIDTAARYGSFINSSVGYIAGGQWPYESAARYGKGDFRLNGHLRLPVKAQQPAVSYDGYRQVIAKTVNGGESWELLYDELDRGYFNGVDFVNELEGWVVGEGPSDGYILHTSDGGISWEEQHSEPGGALMNIKMLDENEGWAVGAILGASFKALILHTTDGGQTWVNEGASLGRYYVTNLDIVDRDHVWATAINGGSNGALIKYTP